MALELPARTARLVVALLPALALSAAAMADTTSKPTDSEAVAAKAAGSSTQRLVGQQSHVVAQAKTTGSPAADAAVSKLAAIPQPAAPSKAEAEHVARLDAALAPLHALALSQADALAIRGAIDALSASNIAKAQELKGDIKDPLARKLVDWVRLRSGVGTPDEYKAFLEANPSWPDRALITQRLEEALFTQGGSSAAIKTHFKGAEPKSGAGLAALGSAHLAEGDKERAHALASRAWRENMIPASLEVGFLARFGEILKPADHKARLDLLLIDEIRWTGSRNERAAFVRRLIPLLPEGNERKKAEARLAAFLKSASAKTLIDALPAESETDWGLVFHKAQVLRRANNLDAAAKLLLSAPTDPAKIVSPDDWWEERRANAYKAMEAGKPKLAYDLVRDAGPLTVNPLKEQTFMAGWLALRHLRDAAAAERHFLAMRKAADGPLSRAKADYWLGRTFEAKGEGGRATEHYRAAARERDTFHGQLASLKIDRSAHKIEITPPAPASAEETARFVASEPVKALILAHKSGVGRTITRPILNHLRATLPSEGEVALVAHLAEAIGDTQMALRIGKAAIARGQNLYYYAYPVHPFPAYTPLRAPPETAFLLAIARQESEFNEETVSGAGARGLLQVMPVTAQHVCRDYKIKCEIPRLLTDKSYNAMLASAYIADRMGEFQGSYVLGLAGYNAGPGRAREWIKAFGDPRDAKVDPVDWIERIPFQETREYVAKVLANIQIYRARLGDGAKALRLEDDLARARSGSARAPIPSTASSER